MKWYSVIITLTLKRQLHNMVKHTQTDDQTWYGQTDELLECISPFWGVGAERVKGLQYYAKDFVWKIL